MRWLKKGLLYQAGKSTGWSASSALQPTPLQLDATTVRIYCGFRDAGGISRIGYVDVQKRGDVLEIVAVTENPVLDIGLPGTFDDNGVVPCAVVRRGEELFMYYAGYQLGQHVRFLVLSGLAVSKDGGLTFTRRGNVPVLERTEDEFLFRVIHTIVEEGGKWRVWYGGGNHFRQHGGRTLPVYDIRYMESDDGITFPDRGITVISTGEDQHRTGRPFVLKSGGKYFMFYGASTSEIAYRLAYAVSADGSNWHQKDDLGLEYGAGDFDSEMSGYPSVVTLEGVTYMIYNGNDYGREGFGYAVLEGNLEMSAGVIP